MARPPVGNLYDTIIFIATTVVFLALISARSRLLTMPRLPRRACADNPTAPTCMECLRIEGLIESLAARGIPWWR